MIPCDPSYASTIATVAARLQAANPSWGVQRVQARARIEVAKGATR